MAQTILWFFGFCLANVLSEDVLSVNEILFPIDNSSAEWNIKHFGYPFETHQIVTQDGYILTAHRIPYGKNSSNMNQEPRPITLILHGFLAVSDIFLFRGPSKDLPYILADSGHDVWLCNARGNANSRNHVRLNPNTDLQFWNFTIHEQGIYDLPATIDYVLNTTGQKSVNFIGHSIGASAFFIMCSMKPEYNAKITMMSALAPAALIVTPSPPLVKLLIQIIEPLSVIFKVLGLHEVFPRNLKFQTLINLLCNDNAVLPFCMFVMTSVIGTEGNQFEQSLFSEIFKHYPAGTSLATLKQVAGIFEGHFGLPDRKVRYNLTQVTAPVSLHYGLNDKLVTKNDVEALSKTIGNLVGVFAVPYQPFNHLDFIWAKDSKSLVYDDIISLMKIYNNR